MRCVFNLDDLEGLPTFLPVKHTKTKNTRLVDDLSCARHFTLWHGEIEPGGVNELHAHEEMEQVFVVLDGKGLFKIGDQEYILEKGGIAFMPAKVTHNTTSIGDTPLRLLIFMAPPPATLDAPKKK